MKTIYTTLHSWKSGKNSWFWNEYRLDGDIIKKVRCGTRKVFTGDENEWRSAKEKLLESWKVTDKLLPEWLKKYI